MDRGERSIMAAQEEQKNVHVSPRSELAEALAAAEAEGTTLILHIGDREYAVDPLTQATRSSRVLPTLEAEDGRVGQALAHYDPTKVKEALRRTAGAFHGIAADALTKDILELREQDTSHHRFP